MLEDGSSEIHNVQNFDILTGVTPLFFNFSTLTFVE